MCRLGDQVHALPPNGEDSDGNGGSPGPPHSSGNPLGVNTRLLPEDWDEDDIAAVRR